MFLKADEQILLDLLRVPTASPMETGSPPRVDEAARIYAGHSKTVGMETVYFQPPPASCLEGDDVPLSVLEAANRLGRELFLDSQPNLVLRLGPDRGLAHTLMFNFHMDTVAGEVPIGLADGRFTGRGTVDMKGPGVALLAGVREALRCAPNLAEDITVLIQCVAGEEGGAMGVHGTRVLARAGFLGRLNVFAEPSDGFYFDHATTSMTARIRVDGHGVTDDRPGDGHNATLVLGFLAQYLARELDGPVRRLGGKLCIGGLHTGTMHNRVYGSGSLLLNFAYTSTAAAGRIAVLTESTFAEGLERFRDAFIETTSGRRAAADLPSICRLEWLKRGLPVLANRDWVMEGVLNAVGLARLPEGREDLAFTCDAFWIQGEGTYTVVFGPGGLGTNGAHTECEFIDLDDLDAFARRIAELTLSFRDHVRSGAVGGVRT